ncbi:hypothetical protein EDC01DRAFT_654521 [Geopyxis carbonaria]|nr:hypothetical protein EDC01DRAFT_654521 [Geopyxis carbonaria]
MATPREKLKAWFPHITSPLIICAPMRTVSGPALVAATNASGGLGFIGLGYDLPTASTGTAALGVLLYRHATPAALIASLSPASPPAAIWLHAPASPSHLATHLAALASHLPSTPLFVQVASVAEGTAAVAAGAHVLVAQGTADAGGHGRSRGASIITLVPELRDAVGAGIPIIAAGGIMDGRGVAAALALGADGVAMGTRFIAAAESEAPAGFRAAVVAARDGGVGTVRTRAFDECRGTGDWPEGWDGRALVNTTVGEWEGGEVERAVVAERYGVAVREGDWSRLTCFAGTGVGLVTDVRPAAEIVEDVREEARRILKERAGEYC